MESKPTFAMWLAKFCFVVGGEPSSKRYFMDKPLVIGAWEVASDAENRDRCDLPHDITITGMLLLSLGYILKLFCVLLPVGY